MQEVAQYGDLGPTKFNTAIKSLTILAASEDWVSSSTLTERLGVESSFIRKVLAKLMSESLVEGSGGYKLIADPARLTVYDVYVALSKDSYIKDQVLLQNKTDKLIAKIITDAEVQFSQVLRQYTIEDLRRTLED
ncbi:RrF2 family transcriptional regulator [Cohnella fermenti]|nr:Rrf2 family transcriptional regulator [Cohnella fermenti]